MLLHLANSGGNGGGNISFFSGGKFNSLQIQEMGNTLFICGRTAQSEG